MLELSQPFSLNVKENLMILTWFLKDIVAGCNFEKRYRVNMTWPIWQRVDKYQPEKPCKTSLSESVPNVL